MAKPQSPTLSMTVNTAPCCAGSGRRGHSGGMEQTANNKFCFKLGKTAAETV